MENYLDRDGRLGRHLRADGARRERHLGHGRPGQSRPGRLLRRRRLCVRAADAEAADCRSPSAWLAGAAVAAVVGVLVALVTVRLRGDYLAIVTLGFAETIRIVASNEIWLTNGTDGLSGIAGPFARGPRARSSSTCSTSPRRRDRRPCSSCWSNACAHSPFGRVLRAIRDDEQVAAVAGKHVVAVQGEGLRLRQRGARARRRALRPLHVATSRPTSSCRC